MAAGCVPIVYGEGGQIEVVGDELRDLLWHKQEECLEKTNRIMNDQKSIKDYRHKAKQRVKIFGKDNFEQKLFNMIE